MPFQSEKYNQLVQKVEEVCQRSQRAPTEVKILAATKYCSLQDIQKAMEAGIQLIGENKIQNAEKKWREFSQNPLFQKTEKHFIGHLQSNKAKKAIQLFDVIESVDSLKLLECLNKEGQHFKKKVRVLLEVNIANDPNKHGFSEKNLQEIFQQPPAFPFIQIEGLMAIVPFIKNPEEVRPYFSAMKKLFDEGKKVLPQFKTLSMGMSHDFEIAIEEGSTQIRIGSLLFGP